MFISLDTLQAHGLFQSIADSPLIASGNLPNIIVSIFTLSILVMIVVEALKFVFRQWFHRWRLRTWLGRLDGAENEKVNQDGEHTEANKFAEHFFEGEDSPFMSKLGTKMKERFRVHPNFRLPRKLFLKLVENRAYMILESRDEENRLFEILTSGMISVDRSKVDEGSDGKIAAQQNAMERNLDAFQLSLSQVWLDLVRIASFVAGAVLGIFFGIVFGSILAWLLLGIIAGFFATILHDILARLTGSGSSRV